jgi:hypothetical protein
MSHFLKRWCIILLYILVVVVVACMYMFYCYSYSYRMYIVDPFDCTVFDLTGFDSIRFVRETTRTHDCIPKYCLYCNNGGQDIRRMRWSEIYQ